MNAINNVSKQLNDMERVVENNLKKCCNEIEEWHKTGLLAKNGNVRRAADKLTDPAFSHIKFTQVENCVNRLARQFVIKNA